MSYKGKLEGKPTGVPMRVKHPLMIKITGEMKQNIAEVSRKDNSEDVSSNLTQSLKTKYC